MRVPGEAAGHSHARSGVPCPAAGFTLVELLVALAIGVVLLVLATPAYHGWIADQALLNHARLLAGSMQTARAEAIKRGHRVNLCKSGDGLQCAAAGGWDQGFLMHEDADRTGDAENPGSVIRVQPKVAGIRISANRPLADYVSYTSLGQARMLSGALQMGTFTLCKTGRREVEVVLVATGRVRIARTTTLCP